MRRIKPLFILVLFVSMIFAVSCQPKEPVKGVESSVNETGDVKAVKITANNANITQGCDPNSQVLQTTNKNTNYNVLNKVNDDWYAVQLPNNQIGFLPQQQCTPVVVNNQQPNVPTPAPGTTPTPTPGKDTTTPAPTPGKDTTTPAPIPGKDTTPAPAPGKDTTTPAPDTTNQAVSSQEQEMVNLINASRKQNGLKPLQTDNQLVDVARMKSKDMIDKNYFSHNSPTYGSPFDMLKNFGVSYLKAGENIAGNQTVQKAHEALMNSPGHRQNILSPDYTHVGIGIQKGGNYGNMFTQLFISK